MADTRLVQTAVLESPDSDEPVILPIDHSDLDGFRAHHTGSRFWCGVLLGGCGRELVTKRYEDRQCHFAHFADAEAGPSACSRGAHSADHLYVRRAVSAWLRGFGHHVSGELRGIRHNDAVDFPLPGGLRLRFQLTAVTAEQWEHDNARARRDGERIQWFLADPVEAEEASFDAENPALLMRCQAAGSMALPERRVEIGARSERGEPVWDRLEDCSFDEGGHVQTPALRAHGRHAPGRRPRPPADAGQARAPWSPPAPKPRARPTGPRPSAPDEQELLRTSLLDKAVELTGRLRLACSEVLRNPLSIQSLLDEAGSLDERLRQAGTYHQPLTDAIGRAEELVAHTVARENARQTFRDGVRLAERLRSECRSVPVNRPYLRMLLADALEMGERMQPGAAPESLATAIRQAATLLQPPVRQSPPEPEPSSPSPSKTARPLGLLREPSSEEAVLGELARETLIEAAREQTRVTWDEFCGRMGRPDLAKARRETVFQILRSADREPDGRERPLLSALLLESDPPQDRDNFIRIARDHRRLVPSGPDHRVSMQLKEIAAVYAHWPNTPRR